MVLKIIRIFIILIIVPELLGIVISRFTKERNLFSAWVYGYLFEFTSFELMYFAIYFCNASFRTVVYSWSTLIGMISLYSLVSNLKYFQEFMMNTVKMIKSMKKISIIFIILLGIQIYFPTRYMQQVDPDDAFYVALTTTTIENNSLFKINPYDGENYARRPLRYCFSALPIYYSALSEILQIHPAVLQHTIWPAIAVVLEFIIYAQIGNKLLGGEEKKLSCYLIFLAIIYMFGFISVYTNFSFFAYRSWQGKALIANFSIPFALFSYWNCLEKNRPIDWLILLATMISSIFMTEMGVFLLPMIIGGLCVIHFMQERKISNLLKSGACCIPQLIVGILYFTLR